MGVLPLQFINKQTPKALNLSGKERYNIDLSGLTINGCINVNVRNNINNSFSFNVLVKIETNREMTYYKNGGIMQYILRKFVNNS